MVEEPVVRMVASLAAREVSAVELFEAHAARIAERNPELNALVLPRLEAARAEAEAADAAAARGEPLGPLHGVPFTAKDPLAVAGMRAPNGSRLLADHVSEADCAPVARLRAAGAILLGKTNVSEFSMWWDSVNPLFGATANPHDVTRTAGGSSGGEAAAVASGMSPLGLGSDLGGSIRNPCHFCGVWGLKPGRDTVPFAELKPLPAGPGVRLMGVVGPLTRSAEDLSLALDVLATPALAPPQRPARIAVFEEDGLQPVSRDCRAAVRRIADALGDTVEGGAAQRRRRARRLRHDPRHRVGELAAGGGRRPHRRAVALPAGAVRVGGRVRAVMGGLLRRLGATGALRDRGRRVVRRAPGRALPGGAGGGAAAGRRMVGGDRRGAEEARRMLTLATYASALGLPAVCVPVMRAEGSGLPVGVQLIGARGSERTLLSLASELEASGAAGWLRP